MTHLRAILYALGSYFAYVLYDTAVKLARQSSVSPFAVMFVVGAVGAVCIIGSAAAKRDLKILWPRNLKGVGFVCLCSVAYRYFNITALKYLSLTLFYAIQFTAPLVIALLSVLLKHEKMTRFKNACLVSGFLGVLIVLSPRLRVAGELAGFLTAFMGVLFYACSTVALRQTSQGESVESVQILNFLSLSLFGLGGESISGPMNIPSSSLWILLIGGLFFTLGNVLHNKAIKHTASTNIAQMHYTQIIIAGIIGYLLWDDVPTAQFVAGSLVIMASGIAMARLAQKTPVIKTQSE